MSNRCTQLKYVSPVSGLLALGAVMLSAGPGQAASAVQENISAVIQGQYVTDTAGDFGPAGASLSGMPVSIQFRYVPADYNIQSPCAHNYPCQVYEAQGTSDVAQAVTIVITLNGHTLSFQPSYASLVKIFTDGSNLFQINADAGVVTSGAGNAGIQLSATFAKQPVFGAVLSPSNPPSTTYHGDLFEIFPADSQAANEILSFSVRKSLR